MCFSPVVTRETVPERPRPTINEVGAYWDATHLKIQEFDRAKTLRILDVLHFWVCLRRANSTRERNRPQNTDSRNGRLPVFSGVFCSPLNDNLSTTVRHT